LLTLTVREGEGVEVSTPDGTRVKVYLTHKSGRMCKLSFEMGPTTHARRISKLDAPAPETRAPNRIARPLSTRARNPRWSQGQG
jgi:hypothetical protein